jgi:hypothetical protein
MQFYLHRIRQRFGRRGLADPVASLREQLGRVDDRIRPGGRIAIAVGSRGISNIAAIVKAVSDYVRGKDAHPFIVPAMGSHGGATADGQRDVLASYGVSEATIGSPVRATMDVIELPGDGLPIRVFMDRHAYESDGVILINRIKPHTDYHGEYESGLMKMALIGLGKLEGALAVHDLGVAGLRDFIGPGASRVLASGRILAGVACVEDAHHETMIVEVLKADEIAREEPRLLGVARNNMPHLPVNAVDVLVVDRMGKDISGVGIDPNITGRIGVNGQCDPAAPVINAVMVCDLTDVSHGNAIGVGLADVITRRLFDKIDFAVTHRNVVASSFLERGKIPVFAETDREGFEMALRSCGRLPDDGARVIRILDTLHLEEMFVSPAVLGMLRDHPQTEAIGPPVELFDERGMMVGWE